MGRVDECAHGPGNDLWLGGDPECSLAWIPKGKPISGSARSVSGRCWRDRDDILQGKTVREVNATFAGRRCHGDLDGHWTRKPGQSWEPKARPRQEHS